MTPYEFLASWTAHHTARSVESGHHVSTSDDLVAVRLAATQWMSHGVTLDSALDACRASGHDVLTRWLAGPADTAASAARAVLTYVSKATAAIDDEYRSAVCHNTPPHTLRDELARTLADAYSRAAHPGNTVSPRYSIVMLHLPDAGTDHISNTVRSAVDDTCGLDHDTVTAIDPALATILVPTTSTMPPVDGLLAHVRRTLGRPVLGVSVDSATADLPEAMRFTTELMTLARTLRRAPKLYRTHDLALEYQMVRPGFGRDTLGCVFDPLRDRPVLLDTIVTYFTTDQNRRVTSKMLYIHPNTLDARLKKISELVGFDISSVTGQRKIEAAVLVEQLRSTV